MTGKDFLKRFEASGIPLSAVYKVCVNAPEFNKEDFKKRAPGAFDYKGNLSTVFKDRQKNILDNSYSTATSGLTPKIKHITN